MPTHLWLEEKRFGRMFVHKRRKDKSDDRSVDREKKAEKEGHLKRLILQAVCSRLFWFVWVYSTAFGQ